MANEFGAAVTALQRKLDEQLQVVADTKRTINMLLKMAGQQPLYSEADNERGTVRADQFYGKGLATSAAEYLALRKQACPPEEILRGLEAGGFDFDVLDWKPDDKLRCLSLSLAKNTGTSGKFHRLKNGTFGLRNWYDEDFLKKASSASDGRAMKAKKRGAKKKEGAGKVIVAATKVNAQKSKAKPEAAETVEKEKLAAKA
jgi:hypothetical protein